MTETELGPQPQDPAGTAPEWRKRMEALIGARAAFLQQDAYDDRGRVVRFGETPRMSMLRAMQYLPKYLEANPERRQDFQRYIQGDADEIPDDWAPRDLMVVQSPETQRAEIARFGMEKFREEHPIRAALADVIDVGTEITTGMVQVPIDVSAGLINLAGYKVEPLQFKAGVGALFRYGVDQVGSLGQSETTLGEQYRGMQEELTALRETSNDFFQIAGKATGFVGMARGMFGGKVAAETADKTAKTFGSALKKFATKQRNVPLSGKVLGTGEAIGGGIARKVATAIGAESAPKWLVNLARTSGAFGAYETVVVRGDDGGPPEGLFSLEGLMQRGKAALHGMTFGALIGTANAVAKSAVRTIFKKRVGDLAPDDKTLANTMSQWAKENRLARGSQETDKQFLDRVINTWADAGAPGVKMPMRRLAAILTKGPIEGAAFSSLDAEFRADLIDALAPPEGMSSDEQASKAWDAFKSFLGTTFGATALHVPMRDIISWQRRAPISKDLFQPQMQDQPSLPEGATPLEKGEAGKPHDMPRAPKPQEKPDAGEQMAEAMAERPKDIDPVAAEMDAAKVKPEPKRPSDREIGEDLYEALFGDNLVDHIQVSLGKRDNRRKQAERAKELERDREAMAEATQEGGIDPAAAKVIENLQRMGWRPGERGKVQIEGTGYSFKVEETGEARPSQELRDALGLPEKMPLERLLTRLEQSSLISALKAKAWLPGAAVDTSGVHVQEVPGKPSKMRAVRMGEVYEADLSPNPQWVKAKEIPARGRDPLPRDQEVALQDLRTIYDNRKDLDPKDRALLDSVIETIDAVSREVDQTVAEALDFLPRYIQEIAGAPPLIAGERIKMLAESLTTKHPGLLVAEASKETGLERRVRNTLGRQERLAKEQDVPDADRVVTEIDPAEAARLRKWVSPDSALAKVFDSITEAGKPRNVEFKAGEYRGLIGRLANIEPGIPGRMEKPQRRQFFEEVRQAGETLGRIGEALGFRDTERGSVITAAGKKAWKVADKELGLTDRDIKDIASLGFMGRVLGALGTSPIIGGPVRKFAVPILDLVKENLGQEWLERFNRYESNTKRREAVYDRIVDKIVQGARKRVPELEKMVWQELEGQDVAAGYSMGHILREDALMKSLGISRAEVSPEVKKLLDAADELTWQIREDAAALGVKIRGKDGKLRVVDAKRRNHVMPRLMTPFASSVLMRGEGRYYDAMMDVLAKANGWKRADVEKAFEQEGWTEHRGVEKIDPIEAVRQLEFFPDHLRMPDGSVFKLLETNIYRHSQHMARGSAMRFGVIQEFGQNLKDKDDPKPTYQKLIESVKGAKKQDMLALALRVAMGKAIYKPILEPGTATHSIAHGLMSLLDIAAAAKMTLSPIQNITEPLGTAQAMLGQDRVLPALRKTWGEVLSGRLGDAIKERMGKEGFELHKPEFIFGGEKDPLAQLGSMSRAIANMLLVPFDVTQNAADVTVHRALESMVEAMKRGEGTANDIQTLQTLFGKTRAQAEAMAKGDKAMAEHYDHVMRTGVSRLTRRGDLPINKSEFALSRTLPKLVRFTGFFQRQTATLYQVNKQLKEAETKEQQGAALAQFRNLMGYNMLAFMSGASLLKLLTGGEDEFFRLWSESLENPVAGATAAFAGSLLGSPGSIVGTSLLGALTGSDQEQADAFRNVASSILPVSQFADMWQFGSALLHRAADQPIESGPYSGKSPLQQLGYFVGREVPAVRAAMGGLFGVATTFMGTDPKVENALKANYRWDRKNAGEFSFSRVSDEERARFRDTMRGAVNKMKAGASTGEIQQWLRQELPEADDVAIRASLRARRVVTGANWTMLTDKLKEAKMRTLGPETMEVLKGYDAALDILAERFR